MPESGKLLMYCSAFIGLEMALTARNESVFSFELKTGLAVIENHLVPPAFIVAVHAVVFGNILC